MTRISGAGKMIRKLVPAVLAMAAAVIFTACGANVRTKLDVDGQFKGTRTITAVLSNGDLNDEINGGAEAIESVVKKYIPDVLTYTKKQNDDNLTYTFTLSFNDIDDYKSKLETILNADPNNKIEPVVTYKKTDSIFNTSVYYEENISSIDLLNWLKYGLRTEKTVKSSSEGDWFESGDSVVVIEGKEYSSSSNLKVDDKTTNYVDEINAVSEINADGSINRTISFRLNNNTIENLKSANVDLDEFFSSLSDSAHMIRSEDENGNVEYIFTLENADAAKIAAETKKILKDDEAVFEFAVGRFEDPDKKGTRSEIRIDLSEYADKSYFMSERQALNYYYIFPGSGSPIEDDKTNAYLRGASGKYVEGKNNAYLMGYYDLEEGTYPAFSYRWDYEFDKTLAELSFSGDNPKLAIALYSEAGIMEQVKSIIKSDLESAVCDDIKFSEETVNEAITDHSQETSETDEEQEADTAAEAPVPADYTVYRLDMSGGNSEDVARRYKNYIFNYDGNKTECTFSNEKGISGSPFKSMCSYSAVFDMTSFTKKGVTDIVYCTDPGEKIYITENCSFIPNAVQEDSSKVAGITSSRVSFTAVSESVNIVGILICVIAAAAGVILIIVIAANAKSWIALAKKQSASMSRYTPPVINPVSSDTSVTEPASEKREPVYANSAPAHLNSNVGNDDDEEEFI